MTTRYSVKRCGSIGFAQNLKLALNSKTPLFTLDERTKADNIFYLNSDKVVSSNSKITIVPSLDRLEELIVPGETAIVYVKLECSIFSDISVAVKQEDENLKNIDKVATDYGISKLKASITGKSTQLEAFSSNKFSVIYGKRGAKIECDSYMQNYYNIDSLIRNGVRCCPNTGTELSLARLTRLLTKLSKFDVIGIHSKLSVATSRSEFPGEHIEPVYERNVGEIVAIFYWYIVENFFAYCGVVSESMWALRYII
jgi:hypothetical protein